MTGLMHQGLELMAVGMGVVFVFLVVLVFVTSAMSRLVGRIAPEPPPIANPGADTAAVSPQTVAVIEAAIRQHRERLSSGRR